MRSKLLYVDTETTGTNPEYNDIWQLAYIIEIDGEVEYEESLLIRPFNFETIQEKALETGGTTREELEKISNPITRVVDHLKDVWSIYIDRYDKTDKFTMIGYNIRFDKDFLYNTFRKAGDKYGLGSWVFWPAIDVAGFVAHKVCYGGLRLENYQLGTVCAHYGIEFEAHDAMEDIKATRELYLKLREDGGT